MHADNSKRNFFRPGGDHLSLLNVYKQWEESNFSEQWCCDNFVQSKTMKRARDIKEQLMSMCERVEIDVEDPSLSVYLDDHNTNITKCIAEGYFYNAAKFDKNGFYRTLKHPHSVMIHP